MPTLVSVFGVEPRRIGGTETFVRALCRAQMARGHVVAVAAGALPGCAEEDEIDGIPVHRRPVPDVQLAVDPGVLGRLVEASRATKRAFRPEKRQPLLFDPSGGNSRHDLVHQSFARSPYGGGGAWLERYVEKRGH